MEAYCERISIYTPTLQLGKLEFWKLPVFIGEYNDGKCEECNIAPEKSDQEEDVENIIEALLGEILCGIKRGVNIQHDSNRS